MSDERQRRMATEAIHAGEIHDPSGAHIAPIFQTSTFTFDGMRAVEEWAEGETGAYIYSRGGNPARTALARKDRTGRRSPPRCSVPAWPPSAPP